MQKNFYIFRHGESTYNVEGRVQGHSDDSLLTIKGREQAYATAQLLKNKKIEIIISSPLKRAEETGLIVSGFIKAPLIFDKAFIEVNVGVIEGMLYTEVLERYKSSYDRWRSSDKNFIGVHFKNGETKLNVRKRVFKALRYYAEKTPYQNIAISAHGIILIQALLALGIEQRDIPNGAIVHLQYLDNNWKSLGFVTS